MSRGGGGGVELETTPSLPLQHFMFLPISDFFFSFSLRLMLFLSLSSFYLMFPCDTAVATLFFFCCVF